MVYPHIFILFIPHIMVHPRLFGSIQTMYPLWDGRTPLSAIRLLVPIFLWPWRTHEQPPQLHQGQACLERAPSHSPFRCGYKSDCCRRISDHCRLRSHCGRALPEPVTAKWWTLANAVTVLPLLQTHRQMKKTSAVYTLIHYCNYCRYFWIWY